MNEWPSHPAVLEIFTWVWLAELAGDAGRPMTLGEVPSEVWDTVARPGIDAVWLMGVWERSELGAAIARANPAMRADAAAALPDLSDDDIVGSAYCVRGYHVDARLGGDAGLAVARAELARRGVRLILDLVPNHVAPDHPWTVEHPEFFIGGTAEDLAADPLSFVQVGERVLACGRDPYFPAWPEVLQLDPSHPGLRAAMADLAVDLADRCDGLRCDMAMLLLDEVAAHTWGERLSSPTDRAGAGFWPQVISAARAARPDFVFWAEAYWDLEPVLLEAGFDACYDKRLYDRLVLGDSVHDVRDHLGAPAEDQRRTVRFVENHDEPRAASMLPVDRHLAVLAATLTLPGVALLHEGESDGRRVHVPVTLGRRPAEQPDPVLRDGVARLLDALAGGLRSGTWGLVDVDGWPDNPSAERLLAWAWTATDLRHLVVVNTTADRADGRVRLPWDDLRTAGMCLIDLLSGVRYEREGDEVRTSGLYVALDGHCAHLFRIDASS